MPKLRAGTARVRARISRYFFIAGMTVSSLGTSLLVTPAHAVASPATASVRSAQAIKPFDSCLLGTWVLKQSLVGAVPGGLVGLRARVSRLGGTFRGYALASVKLDFRQAKPTGGAFPAKFSGTDLIKVFSGDRALSELNETSHLTENIEGIGTKPFQGAVWSSASYRCARHSLKLVFGLGEQIGILTTGTFSR